MGVRVMIVSPRIIRVFMINFCFFLIYGVRVSMLIYRLLNISCGLNLFDLLRPLYLLYISIVGNSYLAAFSFGLVDEG